MKLAVQSIILFLFAAAGLALRGFFASGVLLDDPSYAPVLPWLQYLPPVLFLLVALPAQGLLLFSDRHGSTSPLGTLMLTALAWCATASAAPGDLWVRAAVFACAFGVARCGGARISMLFAPILLCALECLVSHRALGRLEPILPPELQTYLPARMAVRDIVVEAVAAEVFAVAFACVGLSRLAVRDTVNAPAASHAPSENVARMVDDWDEDEKPAKDAGEAAKSAVIATSGVSQKAGAAGDRGELDEVFETLIFFLSKNFRSYSCLGYLSSDGGRTFHLSAAISQAGDKFRKEAVISAGKGLVGKSSQRQAGICSGNVSSYNDHVEYYYTGVTVNSMMVSRVFDVESQSLLGLLVVDSQMREAFSQDHKALLDRFAVVASQLISNVKLTQRLKRQNARSQQAYKMANYFARQSDVASVLKGIVASYPAIFGADSFYFCDRTSAGVRLVSFFGKDKPAEEGTVFPLETEKSVVCEVFRTRFPKMLEAGQEGFGRFAPEDGAKTPIHSLLAAPILDDSGAATAVAVVEKGVDDYFGADSLVLMQILNANAATALAKARAFAHLQLLATVDGLTGIPNHRQFQALLDKEIARHRKAGAGLALLLLDIDHFKNFNDSYGHQLGDEVLRTVAQTLRRTVRPGDHVARYGGEEFTVILERTGAEEAVAFAEKIRRAVADARVAYEGGELQVTVSVGVALYPVDSQAKPDLIHKSDLALYASKHGGRDRVTLYGDVPPEELQLAEESHA